MFTIGELSVLTEEDRLKLYNCGIRAVARVCILRLYTALRQRSGPEPEAGLMIHCFSLCLLYKMITFII